MLFNEVISLPEVGFLLNRWPLFFVGLLDKLVHRHRFLRDLWFVTLVHALRRAESFFQNAKDFVVPKIIDTYQEYELKYGNDVRYLTNN